MISLNSKHESDCTCRVEGGAHMQRWAGINKYASFRCMVQDECGGFRV